MWVRTPDSDSLALTPPTSLWPISGSSPYLANKSKDFSSAVLTGPLVLFQYCSFNTWEVDNSSISANSFGVFTQNSNSVAAVILTSSISS